VQSLWSTGLGIADACYGLLVLIGGIIVMSHETVQTSYSAKEIAPRIVIGFVTANLVILAAGTMGTNEILLRSRHNSGMSMSRGLGKGFSANGNYLGFVDYQYTDPAVYTNTAGVGVAKGMPRAPVGAYIEGLIDFRRQKIGAIPDSPRESRPIN